MQQAREEIFNFMHEHNLCHCPKSSAFNPEALPSGYVPKCMAEELSEGLTNRLQSTNLLK